MTAETMSTPTQVADSAPKPPHRAPRAHAHVASHTPGRLRVRIHDAQDHPRLMGTIEERLQQKAGTDAVSVNARTGSVLVHYDPRTESHGSILQLLRDAGVTFGDVARGLDLDSPELGGRSEASQNIVDSFTDLDRQIAALTGHKVDLKLLFPLTLGGIGLWQLATRGLGITEVPAYELLWYAFDSFWKFHREPAQPNPDDDGQR
jgi:hypothetical protein